jgi:hypothetical protein
MGFEKILEKQGRDVTLKISTRTEIDADYGVEEVTYTDSQIKAIITTAIDRLGYGVTGHNYQGKTIDGRQDIDAIGYVDPVDVVKQFDQIVDGSDTYEVIRVDTTYMAGSKVYNKLLLKRMEVT